MRPCSLDADLFLFAKFKLHRLEEEIARMKKNQERRLHRKNAKIAKEGGTLMTLNRPIKPDTTVRPLRFLLTAELFSRILLFLTPDMFTCPETMRPLRPNGSHEYVKPPLPHNANFHNRVVLTAHHNFNLIFSFSLRNEPQVSTLGRVQLGHATTSYSRASYGFCVWICG